MNDFDGRPFVAGSIVGLRAFDVDALGRLTGVTHKEVFRPGVNVAKCLGTTAQLSGLPPGADVEARYESPSYYSAGGYGASTMTYAGMQVWTVRLPDGMRQEFASIADLIKTYPPVPDNEHQVGQAGCSCGFYGYFDGSNHYAESGRVQAVIEGTGVVSVGVRGFRAEKARLLALILPDDEPKRIEPKKPGAVFWAWHAFWLLLNFALFVLNVVQADWLVMGINATAAAVMGGSIAFRLRRFKRETKPFEMRAKVRGEMNGTTREQIRHNYSDVPTYPTVKAALAEFPLTPPPLPSPEDDEFWTMKAPA